MTDVDTFNQEVVEITPDIARDMLGRNTHNRSLTQRNIDKIANDIKAGRWVLTGDPVKISTEGVLLDGQHRLLAIIKANIAVKVAVAWDVDPAAFEVIDTGARRSTGQMLALAGEENSTLLAGALRLLYGWAYNGLESSPWALAPGTSALSQLLVAHPGVRQSAHWGRMATRDIGLRPTPSCFVAMHYRASLVNYGKATEFFSTLSSGVGLALGSPIYALRQRIIKAPITGRGRSDANGQQNACVATIRAFNAYMEGRQLVNLSMQIAPDGGLPTINGEKPLEIPQ